MTYNKKAMQPLIDKYGINAETNKLFMSIIEMFDNQPNYQLWAVKMVFSKAMTIDELTEIHNWATNNHELVQLLEKKNIVPYSNKVLIGQLKKEILGLNKIALIKDIISHFNTAQRKLLTKNIFDKEYTALEAAASAHIEKWYDLMSKFNKISSNRKKKCYSMWSSFTTVRQIEDGIANALKETYEWDKEDMLNYMRNNASDCDVVFEKDNIVIIHVPSFTSSQKMCGGGRTQWCITKENHYFNEYCGTRDGRDQYFYFDFGRKETDEFAHIGFTTEKGRGIITAQTCSNRSMLSDFKQGNETLNIHSALSNVGAKMSHFLRLNKDAGYSWSLESVINLVKSRPSDYAIAYNKDSRIVINVLSPSALSKLIGHSFVNTNNFMIDSNHKTYALMDFSMPYNDEMAIVTIGYAKDQYGIMSLSKACDLYNNNVSLGKYLETIGMSVDNYLNREAIDPAVLLHKYIDERDEAAAIKLIAKEGDKFDVNFEFNQRLPIFSAINASMLNLFTTIINHPKFNDELVDGFGEGLLEGLIYCYGSEDIAQTKSEDHAIEKMIKIVLDSKTYNFNVKDLNNDTSINVACEYPKMAWIVKELVKKPNVDINVINDFECAALANAIRSRNLEALKALGERPDLKIRKEDSDLAKTVGIKLEDYIKPNKDIFKNLAESVSNFEEELAIAAAN